MGLGHAKLYEGAGWASWLVFETVVYISRSSSGGSSERFALRLCHIFYVSRCCEKWERLGVSWSHGNFKLSHVICADDLVLVARSRSCLQCMIDDVKDMVHMEVT